MNFVKEFYSFLSEAKKDYSDYTCVCVFVLTHGLNDRLITGDNQLISVADLTECFTHKGHESLKGKPKLFFIQVKFCQKKPFICFYQVHLNLDTRG